MAFAQSVKKKTESKNINLSSGVKGAVLQITYLALGFLVSRGAVFSSFSPFGVSFGAAVPFEYMPASLIGTAIGYIVLKPSESFRYIAIIVAIGAIRWLLNDILKISTSKFFAPLVAFLPVVATGVALTFVSTSEITEISMCIVEGVVAAVAAYFMRASVVICTGKKSITGLNQQEVACLVMSGCILLLSLNLVTFENISLGRIFSVLIILLCAKYGGVIGGALSSISTGVIFSLTSINMAFLCGGYTFGGLMAGLFASAGKIAVSIVFMICNTIMSFSSNDLKLTFALFLEWFVAFVIFLFIPKSFGNFIGAVFLGDDKSSSSDAIRRSVVMRLDFASKALANVNSCVSGVSQKLKKLYDPEFESVYQKAVNQTCVNCGMRAYCFEKEKEIREDDFNRLTRQLVSDGYVTDKTIEESFVKKCCRRQELAKNITLSYEEYLSCEQARQRVSQIRNAVAGQFSGLSTILADMAEEFENYETYDTQSAQRVYNALRDLGTLPIDCTCVIDRNKSMIVEIELSAVKKITVSRSVILQQVSKACGRRFNSPCISYEGNRVRIVLNQRPVYDVDIGSNQHVCNNGDLCGDSLNYFNNGMGSTVALISDGMGTGGRAAVDGNMATSIFTKLCKAGLSYDCSLAVVNSSLMVKSEDESLATLDLADINLYTGKVTLMKAGAPVTFVKRGGKVLRKDMTSLPVGILHEVKFAKESVTLKPDDWVVMVSDGAVSSDDSWLERLIASWDKGSAQDLAAEIVNQSIKRRNDGHDDDITAIAIKIIEN